MPHPDDMAGLDDYDRKLVFDMDYDRPHYTPIGGEECSKP
jgi:hypothetical protein